MKKFSIVTFYWGNKKNLESYIEHCSNYTDDVVIINIDLLNSFESFGIANIINIPFDILFHSGHDDILNLVNQYTKYDWIYYLAVGKRIVSIDTNLMNIYSDSKCFYDKELGNNSDRWVKFYNKQHCRWIKKVHETVAPLENEHYYIPNDVIIEWERCKDGNGVNGQYTFNDGIEKRIYENYRQLTRLKWVALEDTDPHPARDFAIELYAKHEHLYSMNKTDLIEYISHNDFSYFGM
jgi:hypothetical protein